MNSEANAGKVTVTSGDSAATLIDDEIGSLARDLATAYKQMARFYHDQLQLAGPEADARARGLDYTDQEATDDRARILERPADQVSWFDLTRLAERNPDDIAAAWSRIKAEARLELASGHRSTHSLEWRGGPWQRAQYLAIRDTFRADTPPQSGIEAALLDTAAEAFGDYLEWSEHLHMQVSTEVTSERSSLERHGEWSPVRLSYAEAIEQSAKMVERAHKRFLQSIKMLHDLQRLSPALYVGHATQINVGQQQVNVAAPTRASNE